MMERALMVPCGLHSTRQAAQQTELEETAGAPSSSTARGAGQVHGPWGPQKPKDSGQNRRKKNGEELCENG